MGAKESEMAKVDISVESIVDMQPVRFSRLAIEISCSMSEGQMLDALKGFLENVTDATWYEWLKELAPEYLKDDDEA
jgi:hypothetical protein